MLNRVHFLIVISSFSTFLSSALVIAAIPRERPFDRQLVFEPNQNKTTPVKWIARGHDFQILITEDSAITALRKGSHDAPTYSLRHTDMTREADCGICAVESQD